MVPRPFNHTNPVSLEANQPAVVIVTPYSTGCLVALELQKRNFDLICLWNNGFSEVMKTHVPLACKNKLTYALELEEMTTIEETAQLIKDVCLKYDWSLEAVVCGGEAGVDLTDALSENLGMLTNGA